MHINYLGILWFRSDPDLNSTQLKSDIFVAGTKHCTAVSKAFQRMDLSVETEFILVLTKSKLKLSGFQSLAYFSHIK